MDSWVRKIPRGGNGNSLQYSCLGNPMDRGTRKAYSPWGHKELDMTERPRTCTYNRKSMNSEVKRLQESWSPNFLESKRFHSPGAKHFTFQRFDIGFGNLKAALRIKYSDEY